MKDLLTPHQRAVADQVLAEEERGRHHLVVYLSGAHAYGFPSPDSDLDLKAIHIDPTARLLGFDRPAAGPNRLEVIDGVEIDYSSNELHAVLVGVLQGNGNYLERLLGATALRSSPEHDALRPLVRRALSRKAYRHYQGFASGQLRDFTTAQAPTAKKVLYVLRTALTGTHLLRTGELVTDVTQLWDLYGYAHAKALVEAKRSGERSVLDEATRSRWLDEIGRAFTQLDEAHATSVLPEEAPNRGELGDWLLEMRRRGFQASVAATDPRG
jgi:predicted nucleotidyltransferase